MGTPRLTWRDLLVITRQSPPTSALFRAENPDSWVWGMTEHLLAVIADEIAVGNWQRQGRPNATRPKPIPRPGMQEPEMRHFGKGALPLSELDAWIAEQESAA